jgi:hypothetical protein
MKSQARDRQAGTGCGWTGRRDVGSGEGYAKRWTFVSNLMGTEQPGGSPLQPDISITNDEFVSLKGLLFVPIRPVT